MDETHAYYDRYWADPNAAPPSTDPTTPVRKSLLSNHLRNVAKGGKVLDLGCGGGEFTDYLNSLGYKAIGLDLSEKAVEFARRRYPGAEFRVGTPEDHSEEFDNQFDVVWATEVIEHVFDIYGFMTALHRSLRPGGLLILTTPYHGIIKSVLIDLFGYANHYQPFGGHIRFFDRASLNGVLTHCGFAGKSWAGYGRPWPLYKSFFVVAQKTGEPLPRPPADS